MADYTYRGAGHAVPQARNLASLANWAGAAVSLALVVGVGVWGYKVLARDVSGIPVVRAMASPMRVAPENPGGTLADHQGLAVNTVAGQGMAEGPAERLVLAPRPAGLSEEDVAQGLLARLPPVEDAPRPVAVQPAPDLAAPEMSDAPQNPLQALADQLAAGAVTLGGASDGITGEDGEDVAALAEIPAPSARPEDVAALSAEDEDAAQAPLPGPGLQRSMRPRLRPGGLQVAALSAIPATEIAAAVRQVDAQEIAPEDIPSGTRLVQIGAFDSADAARSEWKRLAGRFGDYLEGKARVIQQASSGGRTFYRLRAHGFDDLSDARRFCAAFVAQNVDCIPVVTR